MGVLSMAPRTTLLVPLLCLGAAALAAAAPMLFTEEEALAMGPEPEQTKPRPSALMAGTYIQRDIYPDSKKMLDEYNAAWYNTDEESIAGNTLSFAPLESGEGVVVTLNGVAVELLYNVTEVFSWWQGEDNLRVVTTVEDLGIVDTQDIDFI